MFENSSLKFLDEFSYKVRVRKLVIEFWTSFRTRFVFKNSSLKFLDEFSNKVRVRKLVTAIFGRVFVQGSCSKTHH